MVPARLWPRGLRRVGYNYRMTDIQVLWPSAIGAPRRHAARRRQLASRYSQRLSQLEWLAPFEPADCRHNSNLNMLRLKNNAPRLLVIG